MWGNLPNITTRFFFFENETAARADIAQAARRVADIAVMLGETADAAYYARVSDTIMTTLREKLFDQASGTFPDGLNGPSITELTPSNHSAIQSIIFPMMAGVVNETAQPGMGLAMVKALRLQLKGGAGPSSCMAGFWMLQGLYRVGWEQKEAADLALELMVAEGQFSWRNMLAQGATCTVSVRACHRHHQASQLLVEVRHRRVSRPTRKASGDARRPLRSAPAQRGTGARAGLLQLQRLPLGFLNAREEGSRVSFWFTICF